MRYEELGAEIGKLVEQKQIQYGDSFHKAEGIMKILYPNGIPLEQYINALAIIRIIDKLFRIANGNQGNENAFSDICGYALLGANDED